MNINELAEQYGLQPNTVRDLVERAASRGLSDKFGVEIEAMLTGKPEMLVLYGFFPRKGDLVAEEIPLVNVSKPAIKYVRQLITDDLAKQSVIESQQMLKGLIHTVLDGEIVQFDDEGTLYVELQDDMRVSITDSQRYLAFCGKREQPVHERRLTYRRNLLLSFYVLRVEPGLRNGVPCLFIKLSRTAKGLVDGLLRRELLKVGFEADVKCLKRISGGKSYVMVSRKIPPECIKTVSDHLKERVIVKFVSQR